MSDSSPETVVYIFSPEELAEIKGHIDKYPEKRSAVMPVLWIAQNKFGWLSKPVIQLVADSLEMSFAHVYGVASFYTMYFKENVPKYQFDICTCFTCGECGGEELYQHAKKRLEVNSNGFSNDGIFYVRHAECLGACDTAPVLMLNNIRYLHNLDPTKFDELVEALNAGKFPEYHQISLTDQSKVGTE